MRPNQILVGLLLSIIFFAANAQNEEKFSVVKCGTSPEIPGFGLLQNGQWSGLEVEFCKAFATALTGSASNARYVPTISSNRFSLLSNGSIDVITRGTFPTFTRETSFNVRFTRPYFWDLGGILVRSDSKIANQGDLVNYFAANGFSKPICYNLGSLNGEQAARLFGAQAVKEVATTDAAFAGVTNGECIGYTNTAGNLYGAIANITNGNYIVVSLNASTYDSFGFVVGKNRPRLLESLNWIVSGLILAWDQGITQANVDSISKNMTLLNNVNDDAKRMLGFNTFTSLTRNYEVPGSYIKTLTMSNVIKAVGNYGEIFQRTVAKIGAPPDRNSPTTKGGLLVPLRW